jgi:DNA-binding XRE family transcriptional regulator
VLDKKILNNAERSDFFTDGLTRKEHVETKLGAAVMILLNDFRREHKLTQKELAAFLGVSQGMISRWESGDSGMKLSTATKIADKLGQVVEVSFHNKEAA